MESGGMEKGGMEGGEGGMGGGPSAQRVHLVDVDAAATSWGEHFGKETMGGEPEAHAIPPPVVEEDGAKGVVHFWAPSVHEWLLRPSRGRAAVNLIETFWLSKQWERSVTRASFPQLGGRRLASDAAIYLTLRTAVRQWRDARGRFRVPVVEASFGGHARILRFLGIIAPTWGPGLKRTCKGSVVEPHGFCINEIVRSVRDVHQLGFHF